MKEATRFIETLGAILDLPAGSGLDTPPGTTLIATARADVEALRMADPAAPFELDDGTVRWRGRPVPGTRSWPWTDRLRSVGISRLAPPDGEEAFRGWLTGLRKRLAAAGSETAAPDPPPTATLGPPAATGDPPATTAQGPPAATGGPPVATGDPPPATAQGPPAPKEGPPPATTESPSPGGEKRAGDAEASKGPGASKGSGASDEPGVSTKDSAGPQDAHSPDETARSGARPAGSADDLGGEEERIWTLYAEAARTGRVPEGDVRALAARLMEVPSGAFRARTRALDPFGELTTLHALNVGLLSIGLARHLAFDDEETQMVGLAALLHDVGRVRLIGADQATTPDQRRTVVRQHPVIGARLLLDSHEELTIPAVVAYEHHLGWRRAGGYPPLRYARSPHPFSRIVAVCDAYDTLRTERPYRPALTKQGAVEYLHVLGGKSLDPEIVTGFIGYTSEPHAFIRHPSTRPEARLADLRWLSDSGFDPDLEPRPVQL